MKIVVNTRLLIENKLEGIGWFTFETLKIICQNNPEHQFVFLFDRKYSEEFIFSDNIRPIVIGPPARHPVLWYIWYEFSVRRILKQEKPDVFLSPDGFLSLFSKVKSIPVIHDINFFHRPQDLPFTSRFFYNKFFPKYARKAIQIVTVSEYSKQDIVKAYGINPDKISVVYNGCNTLYTPIKEEEKNKIRLEYTDGEEYFIYIGSMHPRKNLPRLFKAFEEFKKKTKSKLKLLLVGEKMFMTKDVELELLNMQYENDVVFTGRLIPEKLKNVLSSAFAMAFVPLYEGFGIPALEAMYSDVPVITSNVSSLPEVTGDAAVYADPFSVESICNAMVKVYEDIDLRQNLIEKGRIQRNKFSWAKTADKLWDVILKSVKNA